MDLVALVREHLAEAHPDVLRSLIATFVEALMGAEVDAICGAAYHQPRAHTSAHTAIAAVLRETRLGTTRAQRSQSVVRGATCPTGSKRAVSFARLARQACSPPACVLGVLTRRLEQLARRPRSRSCRSPRSFEMAHSLDAEVKAFRTRPPDGRPLPDRAGQMRLWSRYEQLAGPSTCSSSLGCMR
jgi:putative transposase